MVILRHEFRRSVGALQLHQAARPELVPPVARLLLESARGGIDLAHRRTQYIFFRIEAGGRRNEEGELACRAGYRQRHVGFVQVARRRVAPGYRDGYRRLAVEAALAEFLGERDPLSAHMQTRCRRVVAILHRHHVIAHHVFQLAAVILGLAPQHAQRDRHRPRPQCHRHHVLRRVRIDAGGNILPLHLEHAVVDRQMLPEVRHFRTEVHIHIAAAAAVIVVPLEEAVGGAVVGVHIHAIDLHAHLRGRGPHQGAHAAIAHRDALFTAQRRVCRRSGRTPKSASDNPTAPARFAGRGRASPCCQPKKRGAKNQNHPFALILTLNLKECSSARRCHTPGLAISTVWSDLASVLYGCSVQAGDLRPSRRPVGASLEAPAELG